MFNTIWITGIVESIPRNGEFLLQDKKNANFWIQGNPKYAESLKIGQEATIQGKITTCVAKDKWCNNTKIQCITLKYGRENLFHSQLPYFNHLIIDGIIGCYPQQEINPVTQTNNLTFLVYNNDKNHSRGIWCKAPLNQKGKIIKGKDVIIKGNLHLGYQKNESGNWTDGTYLNVKKLMEGRL